MILDSLNVFKIKEDSYTSQFENPTFWADSFVARTLFLQFLWTKLNKNGTYKRLVTCRNPASEAPGFRAPEVSSITTAFGVPHVTDVCNKLQAEIKNNISSAGRMKRRTKRGNRLKRRLVLLQVSQTPGWESVASLQAPEFTSTESQSVIVGTLLKGGMLWAVKITSLLIGHHVDEAVQSLEVWGETSSSCRKWKVRPLSSDVWGLKAQQRGQLRFSQPSSRRPTTTTAAGESRAESLRN